MNKNEELFIQLIYIFQSSAMLGMGKLKNPGRTYRRKGDPEKVKTHDFPDKTLGKAVPYGVYDLTPGPAPTKSLLP